MYLHKDKTSSRNLMFKVTFIYYLFSESLIVHRGLKNGFKKYAYHTHTVLFAHHFLLIRGFFPQLGFSRIFSYIFVRRYSSWLFYGTVVEYLSNNFC
jgi:hypothetical protein